MSKIAETFMAQNQLLYWYLCVLWETETHASYITMKQNRISNYLGIIIVLKVVSIFFLQTTK